MRCNNCGKEIRTENNIEKEGVATFEIGWGYFSDKDGERHSFHLCEDCYDNFTKEFKIPIEIKEEIELI